MKNEYQTISCKILKIEAEGSDSKTFVLENPYKGFSFLSGQYVMVSILGFGEAPISISSDMYDKVKFSITVRKSGTLTSKLHEMKKADEVGIRGPYGNGFPLKQAKDKNVLIVAGGCGIEPVRPFILDIVRNPKNYKKAYIFYGAKDESALIFEKDYPKWKKTCDFNLTLDNPKSKKFRKGVVTTLFDLKNVPKDAITYICGPPVMYKFIIKKMLEQGFDENNIFMSLERHMDCGIGICQHCACGPVCICKDGPVFSYAELKNIPGTI